MEILTTTGIIGDSIVLSGNGMNYVDEVLFNNAKAEFKILGENYIYATVPYGASYGPVKLSSTFLGLTGQSDSYFAPRPGVVSFTPSSGLFLDTISLSGFCLEGVTGLTLSEQPCQFSIVNNNELRFEVPVNARKGKVKLFSYSGMESSSSRDFDVAVVVTSFEYEKAFPGYPILIRGKYFKDYLLEQFTETVEYNVRLTNSGEGLKYYFQPTNGLPIKNYGGDLLKDSTYIFNFSGIESGDHFHFTKNNKISGEIFDLSSVDSEASGFHSSFIKNENIYLVPEKHGKVVKVNTSGSFAEDKFEILDLNANLSDLKEFKGGFSQSNSGYLIPHKDSRMVRFGLGAGFHTGTIGVLDLSTFDVDLSGFNGGFQDFPFGYLAPFINGKFTRVNLELFKTGEPGATGIKVIDLTAHDAELTGFAGAFRLRDQAILIPHKNSKLVTVEIGAFDSPGAFLRSGVTVHNLDNYNFCDLVITGLFYAPGDFRNELLELYPSPVTGVDTGSIHSNLSDQFLFYLSQGYCGGPTEYFQDQYNLSEARYSSGISRIDFPTHHLIVSGATSGEAKDNFLLNNQFSGSNILKLGNALARSGELTYVGRSAKVLDQKTYFATGLSTGIYAFSSGWVSSGFLQEVIEISYCSLVATGTSLSGASVEFENRFNSGYCGGYILGSQEKIFVKTGDLYISGVFGNEVISSVSGYLSSGAFSSDGYNFTYGNYLSGSGQETSASYEFLEVTGANSGFVYSGTIYSLSGVNYLDGYYRARNDSSFYRVVDRSAAFIEGDSTTGTFDLIVSGLTEIGASGSFVSHFLSGLTLDYRNPTPRDSTPKYDPSLAVFANETFLIQATGSQEASGYLFSGSGFISSGLITYRIYPKVFTSGWAISGLIYRGEEFYHEISGVVKKDVADNLELFIGGYRYKNSGYLLPGPSGSGYAQIFAFNSEDVKVNRNIDLIGKFQGDYNGGFQADDNGYFVSKTSSKIFKFENEYFDFNNLTSFDTESLITGFRSGNLSLTGLSSGDIESLLLERLSGGYLNSNGGLEYSENNYDSGSINYSRIITPTLTSGIECSGLYSLAVKSPTHTGALNLFYTHVASGSRGDYIDGYTYGAYGTGDNLCFSGNFIQIVYQESGSPLLSGESGVSGGYSGEYVASGSINAFSGLSFISGWEIEASITSKSQIVGFSAGISLNEYVYGVPYQDGLLVRYKDAFEPYLSGYSVSGDAKNLKVIFKPTETLTGLYYFASGNIEYNDSGLFNIVKSNKFLVQFFGSEGDEYFERIDDYSLTGVIPIGALSGNILIARPMELDRIRRYY